MIELLNQNEIFVNRVGSEYISIKLPDSKKARRYKGGIYSEEFRSIGEFENISKRTERKVDEYIRRDTQSEIGFFTDKLNEYTKSKAEYIQSKYKRRVESKNKYQLIIIGVTNLVILIITTIFYFLIQNQMQSLQTWQVPLNLQHTEQNQKYIKVPKKEILQSQDQTTIFIKIKEN